MKREAKWGEKRQNGGKKGVKRGKTKAKKGGNEEDDGEIVVKIEAKMELMMVK